MNKKHLQSLFIQTGQKGAADYVKHLQRTVISIAKMFEDANSPYSGLKPNILERQINNLKVTTPSGNNLSTVIDEAINLIAKNSIIVQHPDAIAHLHCPPLIPALAAEVIISALNQSMDSWDQASAATYTEIKLISWLCETYGFTDSSDGIFTSGGTQSNLMGVMMARDNIIYKLTGKSVQKEGLPTLSDKLRILCSQNSHFSITRSASLLGLGEKSVVPVKTNNDGTINIAALKNKIKDLKAKKQKPFIITATAGTTDHGAIDPLGKLAEVAQKEEMWLHIDAAYGGALILTSLKSRLTGIEHADSITVDFHKMFYQPISCGAFLLKNKTNFSSLKYHSDYLNREEDDLPNLVSGSLATTRRFDGLKLLITLQTIGSISFSKMIEGVVELTRAGGVLIEKNSNFELLCQPQLSTLLFRYIAANKETLDELNNKIRTTMLETGIAILGETKIEGKIYLKLTILNPCLNKKDIERLLNKITRQAEKIVDQTNNCK